MSEAHDAVLSGDPARMSNPRVARTIERDPLLLYTAVKTDLPTTKKIFAIHRVDRAFLVGTSFRLFTSALTSADPKIAQWIYKTFSMTPHEARTAAMCYGRDVMARYPETFGWIGTLDFDPTDKHVHLFEAHDAELRAAISE